MIKKSVKPTLKNILCVVPSCLQVNEKFSIKIKLEGDIYPIESKGTYDMKKPSLIGPFNLNAGRNIQYYDNCLPKWTGSLNVISSDGVLKGKNKLIFDGHNQGVFPGDTRPIKIFPDYKFEEPGFHFIKIKDEESGLEILSNPVHVSVDKPSNRIYWGDPHWQTFFSDGIRCPEELYAFARDEAFLDFGAISDHMEAITDRQWEYFMNVTNDFNCNHKFVTLIGQEWTSHKYGHRNIYIKGNVIEPFRSDDISNDNLEKLWNNLKGTGALLIPHHTSNVQMGCDWSYGWNSELEKTVEIYSGWGSCENSTKEGNLFPIKACGGETNGQYVTDALNKGCKFGFIGAGDIHCGRPGDSLIHLMHKDKYRRGFTAAIASELTRDDVFDAMFGRMTYATTQSRIYLDCEIFKLGNILHVSFKTASEDGILKAEIVVNGKIARLIRTENESYVMDEELDIGKITPDEGYAYLKIFTNKNNMAWSSPYFF